MGEQKWTTKKAQDLVKGDLIPNPSQRRAVEVQRIVLDGDNVMVHCYHDLYRRVTPAIYEMAKDQRVPVAVSGVHLMDDINNYDISE